MMQHEREAEGDTFKDKESFVTQAYKDQMAEAHREAEEERKREGTFFRITSLPRTDHRHRIKEETRRFINGNGSLLSQAS
jgi:hypothetical protein